MLLEADHMRTEYPRLEARYCMRGASRIGNLQTLLIRATCHVSHRAVLSARVYRDQ